MDTKRRHLWLSTIVCGHLALTLSTMLYLWFLASKYNNILTLDGEWLVRSTVLSEFLFQSIGGIFAWGRKRG